MNEYNVSSLINYFDNIIHVRIQLSEMLGKKIQEVAATIEKHMKDKTLISVNQSLNTINISLFVKSTTIKELEYTSLMLERFIKDEINFILRQKECNIYD